MTAIFFTFSTLNEAIDSFAQIDALHFLVAESEKIKHLRPKHDLFFAVCSVLKLETGFMLLFEANKVSAAHRAAIVKMKQFWKGDLTSPFPKYEKVPLWKRTKLENGFEMHEQCINACAKAVGEELPLDWYERRVDRAIKILDFHDL